MAARTGPGLGAIGDKHGAVVVGRMRLELGELALDLSTRSGHWHLHYFFKIDDWGCGGPFSTTRATVARWLFGDPVETRWTVHARAKVLYCCHRGRPGASCEMARTQQSKVPLSDL